MNRRLFLQTACAAMAAPSGRPNIVLILADDLGYECLGCNGGTSYRTPQLDALAQSGVRFTNAHAMPLCAPTRLQLMTGQYNFRNFEAFGILNPKEKTFGHLMKAAGYATAIAGKWQLYSYDPKEYSAEWRGKGMLAKDSGFDEYCVWHGGHTEDKGSRYADPVVLENGELRKHTGAYGEDIFTDFLIRFLKKSKREPFFLYYPMAVTHDPFQPTPDSAEWKSGGRAKTDPKFFKDMVEYMDRSVGRLVSALDELGLRENTLILFYSDNGTHQSLESKMGGKVIRGGKGLTTDAGTHVPLIANWKGATPAGRVVEDLIDSTDFIPTMAEAAGTKPGKEFTIDGRSFLPQLRGAKGNPREWLYCHYDPRPGWDKDKFSLKIFARDKKYKLYSTGEFFDVPADPLEKNPLRELSGEAAAAKTRLQRVIDSYPKQRQLTTVRRSAIR